MIYLSNFLNVQLFVDSYDQVNIGLKFMKCQYNTRISVILFGSHNTQILKHSYKILQNCNKLQLIIFYCVCLSLCNSHFSVMVLVSNEWQSNKDDEQKSNVAASTTTTTATATTEAAPAAASVAVNKISSTVNSSDQELTARPGTHIPAVDISKRQQRINKKALSIMELNRKTEQDQLMLREKHETETCELPTENINNSNSNNSNSNSNININSNSNSNDANDNLENQENNNMTAADTCDSNTNTLQVL